MATPQERKTVFMWKHMWSTEKYDTGITTLNKTDKVAKTRLKIFTSAARSESKLKSILGLTAASLIDKNWNQRKKNR